MGEQIKDTVRGKLYYVPKSEFTKILNLNIDLIKQAEIFSELCRVNVLYMIASAGSGHLGSSFSSMEIMSWLQLNEVNKSSIFFSSKGHDAPALYAALIGAGKLNFDLIHKFRRAGGLPGHPDVHTPNIITNTGSLGMGISKAKGIIFAHRLKSEPIKVRVLLGDGELQEGQIWESLISAVNYKMNELTVIIDHNKLQSDSLVSKTSDLGNLEEKFTSFGWKLFRCDGNNLQDFSQKINESRQETEYPQVIIADTIKGKGVSFMEHKNVDSDLDLYKFHSGAPSEEMYRKALFELTNKINNFYDKNEISELNLKSNMQIRKINNFDEIRLLDTYSENIVDISRDNPKIIALDADLILDTGLIKFKQNFPDRFIECGIAEQDMVSQAGGIALSGFLPIVNSFASFLSSRSNEQIYNNATEGKKILYVGSLAGVIPGGPGHSHQAIRDIAALGGIPGLDLIEPSNPEELRMILDWAINISGQSTYLRLVSAPWKINKRLIKKYVLKRGRGVTLISGQVAALISYGPITLSILLEVADEINRINNLSLKVINLPWLNVIDEDWLLSELANIKHVITLDNHMVQGGQGEKIAAVLAKNRIVMESVTNLGITQIPPFGTNLEVLSAVQFDKGRLKEKILHKINLNEEP